MRSTVMQMSHVAWSVCLSVCVLVTTVKCAKTAEPRCRLGRRLVGAKEPLLNGVHWKGHYSGGDNLGIFPHNADQRSN